MTRGELLDVGSGFAERDAMRGTTTVILVDDHELARQGVRKLLGKDGSIEVLGEAECCCEAISLIAQLRPQVVVLDIRLRDGSGIEVSRAIRRLAPDTKILVLSAYDDSQYVVSMVKLGVSGYLTKSSSGEDLIRAVHHAAEGWLVFSPDIAKKVDSLLRMNGVALSDADKGVGGCGELPTVHRSGESLSGREVEVLQHVCRGLRNRDIAEAMGISVKTVEVHMHRMLLKLGARNRGQAIVNSIGMGYSQGVTVPADGDCPIVSRNVRVSPEDAEDRT